MKPVADVLPRRSVEEILAEQASRPQTGACPAHGITYGVNTYPLHWDCIECRRIAEDAEREWRALHARYQHWLRWSGIPSRNRNATPERIEPVTPSAEKLARAVRSYVDNFEKHAAAGAGMLLLGPVGLGKTVAMTATINAAAQLVHGPVYATWPDVVADMKAGFNGARDDERRQIIERLKNVPLLALDELAVKAQSDFEHSELFGLIDYRYRHQLPTLAAANSTPAAFPSVVGDRVADRLREIGPTLVVTGQSQRGHLEIVGEDAFPEPPKTLTVRIHTRGEFRETVISIDRNL